MESINFKDDLEIDPENLDAEACVQPELYYKWASLAKDARVEMDMAKFNLEITEAEVSLKIRKKPAAYGVGKVTEGSIAMAVRLNDDYKTAYKKSIQTRGEYEILLKAQEAMEQRKRAIELLVQLHGREYFAGPSVPHSTADMYRKIKEKKGAELQEEMISRTRSKKVKSEKGKTKLRKRKSK